MTHTTIAISDLGKRYKLGLQQRGYGTLRESIIRATRRAHRASRGSLSSAEDTVLWALRHVSLTVEQGEVVGLIGHNGAGKTTLLKILSRITEPTEGWADVTGRVGSLLEVGTGFHPELTGRENIFLNGAILGMTRREIRKRFDEIVSFAEIERFLDTPVKRYSSGMSVRLAFAVAAHLEPEILLVDEVLPLGRWTPSPGKAVPSSSSRTTLPSSAPYANAAYSYNGAASCVTGPLARRSIGTLRRLSVVPRRIFSDALTATVAAGMKRLFARWKSETS
jgi:ABC-type polysaccharide/polyol phosphate transport system ATPase subunit